MWIVLSHGRTTGPISVFWGERGGSDRHWNRGCCGVVGFIKTGLDIQFWKWQKDWMGRPLFRYFLRGPPQLDMWNKPGFVKHSCHVWSCQPGSSEFREEYVSRPRRGVRLSHATRPLVTRLCLRLEFSQNISVKTNHLVQASKTPFQTAVPNITRQLRRRPAEDLVSRKLAFAKQRRGVAPSRQDWLMNFAVVKRVIYTFNLMWRQPKHEPRRQRSKRPK